MSARFPPDFAERVLSSQPLPIADATAALVAADSAFEQRDRVVEVFRAALRTLSAFVLAARVQFGKGPGAESSQIPDLIRSLRSRGLTDGQWFAIVREMLRPWAQAPASHPLADLVTLVHGKKSELPKLVDELLAMRKSETVAHGASGTKAALAEILDRRVPQLVKVLAALEPLWTKTRLVVPLATPDADDDPQPAWLLMGDTPARGRWRRVDLAPGVRAAPGEALLVDPDGKPLLALHPLVLVRRPSPEAVEEVFVLDGGTKKGAVYVALPSMAEQRETEAWAALSRALEGDEEAPPENPEIGGATRPFRGLASFGPEHAALFFGREEQTQALANRIRRHPFVTVTGPSGSGKTSLLRAGALPTLTDHTVAVLRPGARPLEALAAKITEATSHYLGETDLLEKLRADPSSLGPLLAQWSRESPSASAPSLGKVFRIAGEPTAPKIAIVVDQAEELLTLCHDDADRTAFAKALASAGGEPDGASRVVLSVREDFFGRLATVPPLRGVYSRCVEVVTTPDRDALARTLYLPAKQFGYAFEDEQLVTTMVDTVASEPAALALLQFCADRLWEVRDRTWRRLTWDAYRALGGVEGALAAHADRVLAEMSPAQQKACRGLLLRLVTADRTRAVVARRELLESAAAPEDAAAVLDRLIAGRLLTAGESEEAGEVRLEIVHEALLRHWGALSGWLDEDVEGQRLTHALRQAAREWQTRNRPRGLVWRGEALDDLRRWRKRATDRLTGEEAAFVQASEAEERRGTRIRRGLVAGGFVATAAFATFMFFQWRAADDARHEAERQHAAAEVRGLVSEARNHEPAGKPTEALALLRAAASLEAPPAAGASLVSLDMERLARAGAAARVLTGHAWGLVRVALSPDGARIATASRDGTVKLWDLATGAPLRTLAAADDDPILAMAYSPDGRTLAASSGTMDAAGGAIHLWDVATGTLVYTLEREKPVSDVAFSPDGKLLFACAGRAGAELWDVASGTSVASLGARDSAGYQAAFSPDGALLAFRAGTDVFVHASPSGALVTTFSAHEKTVLGAAFSHDGARIASASRDGTLRVWEPRTGRETLKLAPSATGYDKPAELGAVAWSPDDTQLAVAAKDGAVRLVDTATGAVRHTLLHHTKQAEQLTFSPDGRRLAVASLDGDATVWDAGTGALVRVLRGHEDGVCCAAFAGDDRLVTGGEDRTARVWDIGGGPFVRMLDGHTRGVERLAASRDGAILASASGDGTARVWDVQTGKALAVLGGHEGPLGALALSPDGALAVTSATNAPPKLWDARTGAERLTLAAVAKGTNAAEFSPDGALVAAAEIEGAVRLFDARTGAEKKKLAGHDEKIARLAFSSDGSRLVSASWDGTARLWDPRGDATEALHVLRGTEGWVTAAVFSPDDRTVVIAANEEARVFDVASGALLRSFTGHEQQINAVAFSPDGALVATASLDTTVRTYRADTGAPVRTFTGHTEGVLDVVFSPDGERLYSAGDSTVRVWHAALGSLLETFPAHRTDDTLRNANVVLPLGPTGLAAAAAQDGSVLVFRSPKTDRAQTLTTTGALGNHRVCRDSLRVVPVLPHPAADTVWAPPDACTD